jgi:site-specific DNA-methyltransferase (adenine-specific)
MIYLGDCIEWMRTLPDKSVDHVITDPPYEKEAHTKGRRGARGGRFCETPLSFDAITPEQREAVAKEIVRVAKRWCLVFAQVEGVAPWRVALGPWRYVRTMIWVKDTTTPQMTGDRHGMGWESIVVTHDPCKKRWNGGGRNGVFRAPSLTHSGKPNDHETQKPIKLMLELVSLFTDPGDLIIDPFAGSGTTGVAALRLGRRFMGCELKPEYHALATERLAAESQGQSISEYRAGQLSLLGGA